MEQHDAPGHPVLDRRFKAEAPPVGTLLLTAPQHDVVEATLGALRRGVSLVVITGDPGSGRSLVAGVVAKVLLGEGARVDRGQPPGGLGQEVLLAHAASLLRLDPALLARAVLPPAPVMVAPGLLRVVAMVVDDADAWPADALRMLLGLARVRLVDGPLLHVVLVGQASLLRPVLSAEALPAHASLRIAPLSPAQGREYLARHLAAAPFPGARLSAWAADDILAQACGSPGRIDTLVRSCLAAQPAGMPAGCAAGGASLFRRSAVPAAVLMLGVVATALLPHSRTPPALPDVAGRAAPASSPPAALDTAGVRRRPGCPPTRDAASARADGTPPRALPDLSCPPVPDVLARLQSPAPPPPPPQPGALVDPPLLLLAAPVAIGAERASSAVTPGLPSLTGLVLPPSLDHLEVAVGTASTAGGAANLGTSPASRLPTGGAAGPRGAARTAGNGSALQQAHMGRSPGRLEASASQKARTSERAPPQARRHDAPLEQPSLAPPAARGGIRDNPDGLVRRAGVPYFCKAIRPGNQAESAYIQQVCGR